MARPASGKEILNSAKAHMTKVRSIGELRQVQAVILPLEFGFTMDQVAAIIGVSKGWACRLRTDFIRSGGFGNRDKHQRGGRRRENMTREEARFLAPFFEKAANGGILVVGEIKKALDDYLGRTTALASVYNLLHRHNWRKLAPDKSHPKSDAEVQKDWKKIPGTSLSNKGQLARFRADPGNVSRRSSIWSYFRYTEVLVP